MPAVVITPAFDGLQPAAPACAAVAGVTCSQCPELHCLLPLPMQRPALRSCTGRTLMSAPRAAGAGVCSPCLEGCGGWNGGGDWPPGQLMSSHVSAQVLPASALPQPGGQSQSLLCRSCQTVWDHTAHCRRHNTCGPLCLWWMATPLVRDASLVKNAPEVHMAKCPPLLECVDACFSWLARDTFT